MNETLYMDASSRLPVYALQSQLQIQILNKSRSLKEFGLETAEEQTWFVFLVLCYLMKRSLQSEGEDGCTLEEICWEIQDIIKSEYPFYLDEQQCMALTRLVIIDILCNGGTPITYHTGTVHPQSVSLNFLSSPTIIRNGRRVGVYRMAGDGYRILLGTREIEEEMQITVSSLILQMQIRSKNYTGALERAKDQIDHLLIQENRIREKITALHSDVLSVDRQESEKMFQDTLETYRDASEQFKNIRRTVSADLEDARKQLDAGIRDEKVSENVEMMNRIDGYVQFSILVLGRIIHVLNEYLKTRRQETFLQMGQHHLRTRSVRKDLFEPLLQHPAGFEQVPDLLNRLFIKKSSPVFRLESVLQIRQYRNSLAEELPEEYAELEEDEEMARIRSLRLAEVSWMHEIFAQYISRLLWNPGHQMSLQDFSRECPQLQRRLAAGPLKEMLSSWSLEKEVDLPDLMAQEAELDESVEELYSLPLSLLNAMSEYEDLKRFSRLEVFKTEGSVSFPVQENGLEYLLTIDNIVLKLERGTL